LILGNTDEIISKEKQYCISLDEYNIRVEEKSNIFIVLGHLNEELTISLLKSP